MNTKTAQIPEDATGQPRRVVVGRLRFSDTFRALRHRNYRLFFTGQIVSLTGIWMEQTAMGWMVYQLSGSEFMLGLVAAAGQRYVPRTLAFTGLGIFSVALLIFSRLTLFPAVLVCLAFAGFGMMLFFSTSNTTVQTIVPDEMRGRVMGVWALAFGGMIPLGSLQAGFLAEKVGPADTTAIGALVCGIAGVMTWFIVSRREARERKNAARDAATV